jgi:beta-lactamase regulating signal transducer with metallopeptidase domain
VTLSQVSEILGLTVLHTLWIGILIGFLVFAAFHLPHAARPRIRHSIAVVGMLAFFVASVSTFAWLFMAAQEAPAFDAEALALSPKFSADTTRQAVEVHPGSTPNDLGFMPFLAWGWISGVAFMSLRLIRQWFIVRRFRVIGVAEPTAGWVETFDALKAKFAVGDRVRMLVSHIVDSPMVVGWVCPVVLVPASAFTSLTPEQLRMILIHELVHIVRHDHLLNMIQGVVEVLLFFHPVTWWLSRKIRVERENCCDDAALSVSGSPRLFAEALLILETLRVKELPQNHLLTATGGLLMDRISRLFNSNHRHSLNPSWRAISAGTVMVIAGMSLAGLAIDRPAQGQDRGDRSGQRAAATPNQDLDALKQGLEQRLRAMGTNLREQVAAGELSAEDAKAKFDAAEKQIWTRYRAAEAKQAGNDSDQKKMSQADYDDAVKKMTEMVKAGTITREQMQQRLDRMKRAMSATPNQELDALKKRFEERLRAMGKNLREQVAAGELDADDAKAKYDAAEKQMWIRYRAAEAKQAGNDSDQKKMSQADYDDAVKKMTKMAKAGTITREDFVKAMATMEKMVAAGELTQADMRARLGAMRQMMAAQIDDSNGDTAQPKR